VARQFRVECVGVRLSEVTNQVIDKIALGASNVELFKVCIKVTHQRVEEAFGSRGGGQLAGFG